MADRDAIRVFGADAVSYLQGQLSQDVAGLEVGERRPSFVLEPNGKVTAWLGVRRVSGDELVLDVDLGVGAEVVERLAKFKLRTKANIELIEPMTVPEDDLPSDEARRIEQGLPKVGAEIVPGATIPAELGQRIIDASVSFTKGCYTGQELVARIDSRGGNVPRHLRGLVVGQDQAPPPVGARIEVEGNEVGTVTSVAWSPRLGATVALGFVRRSVEPPVEAMLRWGDGGTAAAELRVLPL